jgi:hypothetical protein
VTESLSTREPMVAFEQTMIQLVEPASQADEMPSGVLDFLQNYLSNISIRPKQPAALRFTVIWTLSVFM